jgi:hypothetical protein
LKFSITTCKGDGLGAARTSSAMSFYSSSGTRKGTFPFFTSALCGTRAKGVEAKSGSFCRFILFSLAGSCV